VFFALHHAYDVKYELMKVFDFRLILCFLCYLWLWIGLLMVMYIVFSMCFWSKHVENQVFLAKQSLA